MESGKVKDSAKGKTDGRGTIASLGRGTQKNSGKWKVMSGKVKNSAKWKAMSAKGRTDGRGTIVTPRA